VAGCRKIISHKNRNKIFYQNIFGNAEDSVDEGLAVSVVTEVGQQQDGDAGKVELQDGLLVSTRPDLLFVLRDITTAEKDPIECLVQGWQVAYLQTKNSNLGKFLGYVE
jgi:hypothetical protein